MFILSIISSKFEILSYNKILFFLKFSGFFRGLSLPMMSYGLINSILFGIYSHTITYIDKPLNQDPNLKSVFIAGSFGKCLQVILHYKLLKRFLIFTSWILCIYSKQSIRGY